MIIMGSCIHSSECYHVTPVLTELHWLPIADRILFKTLLCVYKSLYGLCPQYLSSCLVVKTKKKKMKSKTFTRGV